MVVFQYVFKIDRYVDVCIRINEHGVFVCLFTIVFRDSSLAILYRLFLEFRLVKTHMAVVSFLLPCGRYFEIHCICVRTEFCVHAVRLGATQSDMCPG